MNERIHRSLVFIALIALCVTARLTHSVWNFSPVAAAALFAGFYFRNRIVAVCVPVAALAISDIIMGGYDPGVMVVVYVAMILPVFARPILRSRLTAPRVGATALACSIIFFVATNGAVWYFGHFYARTATGLGESFLAGLPFMRHTIAGDLFWAAVFFGAYAAVRHGLPGRRPASRQIPSGAIQV